MSSRRFTPLSVNSPTDSASPVAPLLPALRVVLERIAPERVEELAHLTDGVHLEIADSARWICEATAGLGVIRVSTRVLEMVWALGFAYWVVYQEMFAGKDLAGARLDPRDYPRVQEALPLARWAIAELSHGAEQPWPATAPQPSASPAEASVEHVADEIALCAMAFFLHHELAHTYVPTSADEPLLDHERACDAAAAAWILGGALDDKVFQKRALGTAVALLMIASRGIHTGDHDGRNHPLDFDRLVDTLSTYVPPTHDVLWGMTMAILALHTSIAGMTPPEGEFVGETAFHDVTLAYQAVLRRRIKEHGHRS